MQRNRTGDACDYPEKGNETASERMPRGCSSEIIPTQKNEATIDSIITICIGSDYRATDSVVLPIRP